MKERFKEEARKCLSNGIENLNRPEEISSRIIQNFIDFLELNEKD